MNNLILTQGEWSLWQTAHYQYEICERVQTSLATRYVTHRQINNSHCHALNEWDEFIFEVTNS